MHHLSMPKVSVTWEAEEAVVRALAARAARTGVQVDEIVELAIKRELGLELLDRLWARADLDEVEGMQLALEAQRATRRQRG